jgi:crotonobetainyl-CoA:carnitine CoA-transferase CaiB-like acyl-CoA transferase
VTKILTGIRVIEVAEYAMVPAAGAVLADWGADVVKIEHATRGDALRTTTSWGVEPDIDGFTYAWEPCNRGKRSVALDLTKAEALEILFGLVRGADIFLTNLLPRTRSKLGIDVEDIRKINPRCIYARGSAYGPNGPEAAKGGFDGLAYWQRSGAGLAAMPTEDGDPVNLPGPAFGDTQTGMALAGGIVGALFHRERAGEALTVDCSLLGSGAWAMQPALVGANLKGVDMLRNANRATAASALTNHYRTSDNRFVALLMVQGDRYWATLCRLFGREDLVEDSRFATLAERDRNNVECIRILDGIFASQPLSYWVEKLSQQDGQWAVVQPVTALNSDPQALANRYVQTVDYGSGRQINLVASPVMFDGNAPDLTPAPELGAHTEEVLNEFLAISAERISELKKIGAIG